MPDSRPTICVIGAGITGLVSAWELSRRGFIVKVVEQHSTPGGMLSSMRLGHEYIELLPHHIRKSDRNLLSLLKELGLLPEVEWFDSYWYGRVGRKKLGYLNNGFHSLISALTQEITDNDGIIHYGYTAMDISQIGEAEKPLSNISASQQPSDGTHKYQISCVLADCTTVVLEADNVLFTASCRNFAHITHDLSMPTDYRDSMLDVTYKANMCLMLLMKTQFTGCFSRPIAFNAPFQRIIEHTNLVGERRYGGHVVYLSGSFANTNPLWTQSDAEVFSEFFKHLQLLNPATSRGDILAWRLTRTRYATPTTKPDYNLIKPLMPGLYVSSLALVDFAAEDSMEYRMDACVSMARHAALMIDQDHMVSMQKNTNYATIDRIY